MRLAIFLVLITLASVVPLKAATTAEWNIIVYVAADNDLAAAADADLAEMGKVGSTEAFNILVQVKKPFSDERDGTRRYRLTTEDPYGDRTAEFLPENTNMGDPSELSNFVSWAISEFPAKRNAVIIWSHGSGWRDSQKKALQQSKFPSKAVVEDFSNNDQLYVAEVEAAFKTIFNSHGRLDFIGFDACLMSMIEVWTGLHQFGAVGVSSQDLEPGFGWDYAATFKWLDAHPQSTAVQLASTFARTYRDSIRDSESESIRSETFTISVLELNKLAEFSQLFEQYLSSANQGDLTYLRRARKAVTPFSFQEEDAWPNGIDLSTLLSALTYPKHDPKRAVVTAMRRALSAAILESWNSDDLVRESPKGLSIYYPETISVWEKDREGAAYTSESKVFPSKFIRSSLWPRTLRNLLYGEKAQNATSPAPIKRISFSDVSEGWDESLCSGGRVNETRTLDRSSFVFKALVGNGVDFLDVDVALLRLFNSYCASDAGKIDPVAFDKLMEVAKRSNAGALFTYTVMRVSSENDLGKVEEQDFIYDFLSLLQKREPAAFDGLKDLFGSDWIAEAQRGPKGVLAPLIPTEGAVVLYDYILVRLAERDVLSQQASTTSSLEKEDRLTGAYFILAGAAGSIAHGHYVLPLNKRLVYGEDVDKPWEPAVEIKATFDWACSMILRRRNDKIGTLEIAERALRPCVYETAMFNFLEGNTTDLLKNTNQWLNQEPNAAESGGPERWQMQWMNAYAAAREGKVSSHDIDKAYLAAFQELLTLPPETIDRMVLDDWSRIFPNANITADLGDPTRSAYLFFCHWINDALGKGSKPEELLRIAEYSRLFDGSSSVVTGFFGGEADLLDDLRISDAPEIINKKELIKLISDRISKLTFANIKENTVVYFANSWAGERYIFVKAGTTWHLKRQTYSRFTESLDDKDTTSTKDLTYYYDHLITPIIPQLMKTAKGPSTLYIVPSAAERKVPFAALRNNGHFLIDEFTVLYHASLVSLRFDDVRPRPTKVIAVHSPLANDRERFSEQRLAAGARDAEFIKRRVQERMSFVELKREKATKAAIQAEVQDGSIVHIVAHAFALASDPASAGLVLTATDPAEESVLTIADVLSWRRKPDLIMLAGCETGKVRVEGAFLEEASGLVMAGAANAVGVSLWKLQDNVGATILQDFYSELFKGKDYASALRTGQLSARKYYGDEPKLWGSVVIYSSQQ